MTTVDEVTQGKRNPGGAAAEPTGARIEDRAGGPAGARPRAWGRLAALGRIPFRRSALTEGAGAAAGCATAAAAALCRWLAGWGRRARECSPYADRPASIHDVVAYTARGGWVPGEHPWWVEAPGYVWGVLVAIPLTVAGNAVLWVAQRFSRAVVIALVVGVLWYYGVLSAGWLTYALWAYAGLVVASVVAVLGGRQPAERVP